MELSYDNVANALYLRFSHEKVQESEEIGEGIIVDYGEGEHIIGVEILDFSERNLDLNNLIYLKDEEVIPKIVQCQ